MPKQTIVFDYEDLSDAFGGSFPSPMTVKVQLRAKDVYGQLSDPVVLECTNPVPSTPSAPTLQASFETVVGRIAPISDTDLDYYEWSVEENSGSGFAEVSGSPFKGTLAFSYVGTAGYSYRMRVRAVDVFGQAGSYSAYSNTVTLAAIGPDDLTDDVWQLVVTESAGGHTDSQLAELYDRDYTNGPSWTTTSDTWVQFEWPVQHVVSQVMVWLDVACNIYFAVSEDGSTWEWLGAEADHTGAGTYNDVLVAKTDQASASTDYLAASSGKNRLVLPTQKFLKAARLYIKSGQTVQVHELLWWKLVAGDELRGGILASLNFDSAPFTGTYFDLDNGIFKIGNGSDWGLEWDGTTLTVRGSIYVTGSDDFSLVVGSGEKDVDLSGWWMGNESGTSEIVGQSSGVTQVLMNASGQIVVGSGTKDVDLTGIAVDGDGLTSQNAGATQITISTTDGSFSAGDGSLKIDQNGISLLEGELNINAIDWHDASGNQLGTIYINVSASEPYLNLWAGQPTTVTAGNVKLGVISYTAGPIPLVNSFFAIAGSMTQGATWMGFYIDTDECLKIRHLQTEASGTLFVNETDNANQSFGLTINQSTYDDEILALKSSDIAHGVTDFTETDTFACFRKEDGAAGGLDLRTFSTSVTGFNVKSFAGTEDTGKLTTSLGNIVLSAKKISGTGATTHGANANLLVIRNHTDTKFIFDADGDAHADVSWTTFGQYDDIALLEDLELALLKEQDPLKYQMVDFLKYNRDELERIGIVHFDEERKGHAMVNLTRLSMLLVGAIKQLYRRIERGDLETPRRIPEAKG